jgi:hypothetical protein
MVPQALQWTASGSIGVEKANRRFQNDFSR